MTIRGFIAGFFLVLGSILTIPGSIAIWQEDTILNEDNFVKTATDVLDTEEVQTLAATRMADTIMVQLDVENRVDSAITNFQQSQAPDSQRDLTILERPIVSTAREAIYRVCLRAVQSDLGSNTRDRVLRTAHRAFTAVIKNENEVLKATNGQVVLDLRPLVIDAINNLASENAAGAADARLSPDAAQVVLVTGRDQTSVWKLLGWLDDFDPIVPLIAVAMLLLALLAARNRTLMLAYIGSGMIVAAVVTVLVASTPIKDLVTSWPPRQEGKDAAAATYDVLLDSFRRQETYVVLVGVGLIALSWIVAHRHLLREIPGRFSSVGSEELAAEARSSMSAGMTGVRAVGLAAASITLALWPDPSTRVLLTVIGLLGAYLGVLWIFTSDSPNAASMREHARRYIGFGEQHQNARAPLVARWAGILRIVGICVGLAVLTLTPDITVRLVVFVVAAGGLFLVLVDYLASDRPPSGVED